MKLVTLDIETITPGWEPPEPKLEPWWPQAIPGDLQPLATTATPLWKPSEPGFPPLPKHVPCVICWLVFDTRTMSPKLNIYRRAEVKPANEADALETLAQDLEGATRIITWNGRGFDMPLLTLRAMLHRVNWSFWEGRRHRYENYKKALVHFDLMDQLCDQGGARYIQQDHVCELLGMPGKYDIHGGQVGEVWEGDPDRVVTYCVEDVWQLWLIYLRWAEVFKCQSADQVETLYKWLGASMEWGEDQPELSRWFEAVNREGSDIMEPAIAAEEKTSKPQVEIPF